MRKSRDCSVPDRVAHPKSGRTYSQEKPPTREDLYYYAERTGTDKLEFHQANKTHLEQIDF